MKTEAGSGAVADTIFAIASGVGRSAVAVIRISGPATSFVLRALLSGRPPDPRRASFRRLLDPASGDLLDKALVLWLPGPSTFTGEDQAELQIHGSPAVRAAVLRTLASLPSCRPAEAGEFTRRAFINGKLDLSAVEGLADLIDAETEAQRKQAVRQLEGRLAAQVEDWRERLIDALAACEAALDFSDEDDVPDEVAGNAAAVADAVRSDVVRAIVDSGRGERVREGFQVVIAGAPNAGKSTLLNALARRDVAIVSPIPGTTRDIIEIRCDLSGLPVTFVDTAGLRDSEDAIEREGISRARQRMGRADLVLWLVAADDAVSHRARSAEERFPDASRIGPDGGSPFDRDGATQFSEAEAPNAKSSVPHAEMPAAGRPRNTHQLAPRASFEASLREAPQDEGGKHSRDRDVGKQGRTFGADSSPASPADEPPRLVVATKSDLAGLMPDADLAVSAVTGIGLPELLARIETIASDALTGASDALLTRERHRLVLTNVVECLDRAVLVGQGAAIELLAEDIRLALRHLGRITGAVDVEDVLDRIFASFCIGK